nr:putative general negative regulator of transcription C16C9.04c [Tanacetum cinerariifolium]
MNNVEEKRCHLYAEEMDWTNWQLKPYKCSYQVLDLDQWKQCEHFRGTFGSGARYTVWELILKSKTGSKICENNFLAVWEILDQVLDLDQWKQCEHFRGTSGSGADIRFRNSFSSLKLIGLS